jgi:arsenite methyltransferase
MKTTELALDEARATVRERYARIAEGSGACSSTPTCCGAAGRAEAIAETLGYNRTDLETAPKGANLGLGCGNPIAIASLQPGQTVLDLGSGAGFDAFLAARAVGPSGRVIGVDMTPGMITKARQNQVQGGFSNVEFRLGEIEHLPVADASVDVILSNCVINLSPDKPQVFREALRVLKAGGRLAVSDIVALQPFPESLRKDWELYTGCIAGAALLDDLKTILAGAGFENIRVAPKAQSREVLREWFPGKGLENFVAAAMIEAVKPV